MTRNEQDRGVEPSNQRVRDRELEGVAVPGRCMTETFNDREVILIRCLEQKNCRYKQRYLHMSICSCPDLRPS